MSIHDLLRAVDTLTADELRLLHERVEQRQLDIASKMPGALDHALDMLRSGLSDEQLNQIEWAMNLEIIQPPDKTAWQA